MSDHDALNEELIAEVLLRITASGAPTIVVTWAMRHGSMTAQTHATLDEATYSAAWSADAGTESLVAFETFAADGTSTVSTRDEACCMMYEAMQRIDAAYESRQPSQFTHVVELRDPIVGEWAEIARTTSHEAAAAKAEGFPPERVRIRRL